jgi:hypothetical protein
MKKNREREEVEEKFKKTRSEITLALSPLFHLTACITP